jgi:hypothetical protein
VLLFLAKLCPEEPAYARRAHSLATAQGDEVVARQAAKLIQGTLDRPATP